MQLNALSAFNLLQFLSDHRDELYKIVQHGEAEQRIEYLGQEDGEPSLHGYGAPENLEPPEYTLYWHPSEMYTARLAYGNDTPLWGSERLDLWYDNRWITGKVGHVGSASGLVLRPRKKEGNPEYITLTVGSRVRNVSKPVGDGTGPEEPHEQF